MRKPTLLLLVVLALAACGGGQRPGRVVRIIATDLGSRGGTVVALPSARADGREAPLESVLPLVPAPLPAPGGGACGGRGTVTIALAGGRTVRYGACGRPPAIDLLQAALVGEARQWRAPLARTTRIVGARPAEARALRRILAQIGPTRVTAVGIEAIAKPRKWGLQPGQMRIRVESGPSVRAEWEAGLLADRYASEAGTEGLRPVGLAAGSGEGRPTGLDLRRLDVAAVRRAVARAVGSSGRIVELRDESGAPALTLRAGEPASFLKHAGRRLLHALARVHVRYEYVGVEDAAGAVVYAWGFLPSEGMVYPRPDLDACGPIEHSEAAGSAQPPCPAR